jgi:hypothetical protein
MTTDTSPKEMYLYKDRRQGERRKILRRSEDRAQEQAQHRRTRKLHSLLELGQLIGPGSPTQRDALADLPEGL